MIRSVNKNLDTASNVASSSVTHDVKEYVCREYPDRRDRATHIFFVVYQNSAKFPLMRSSVNE